MAITMPHCKVMIRQSRSNQIRMLPWDNGQIGIEDHTPNHSAAAVIHRKLNMDFARGHGRMAVGTMNHPAVMTNPNQLPRAFRPPAGG